MGIAIEMTYFFPSFQKHICLWWKNDRKKTEPHQRVIRALTLNKPICAWLLFNLLSWQWNWNEDPEWRKIMLRLSYFTAHYLLFRRESSWFWITSLCSSMSQKTLTWNYYFVLTTKGLDFLSVQYLGLTCCWRCRRERLVIISLQLVCDE